MKFFKEIGYWYFGLTKKLTKKYFNDFGENNKILLVYPNGEEKLAKPKNLKNVSIKIKGNNNLLKIHVPFDLRKSSFEFRCNNSIVEIQRDAHLNLNVSCLDDESSFYIGKNCHSLDVTAILCGNSVKIGNNCMFSEKILLLDDTHSVIDVSTRDILNREKSELIIGDHCWIGEHVTLLKKSRIPKDCIVAYGAIVTKPFFEENCVYAGNPAGVVKRGISWNSLSPKKYSKEKAMEMRL